MCELMLVAGIEVPLAAVALLALRLDRFGELELSSRLGFAVDLNRSELRLRQADRAPLLRALGVGHDTDELDELRVALQRTEGGSGRSRGAGDA